MQLRQLTGRRSTCKSTNACSTSVYCMLHCRDVTAWDRSQRVPGDHIKRVAFPRWICAAQRSHHCYQWAVLQFIDASTDCILYWCYNDL